MGDMYPAFLLLLLACSAHVTFGKALFTSAECDLDMDPLCDSRVHLVKRGASGGDCSAGCEPPTVPVWEFNNVCKCMTPEQQQNAVASAMDGLLGGLVKRSAASDSCSDWECIGNICTCHDGKSKRSASGGDNVDSGDNSLPSAREIIDSTKDKIRKDFEKNPLLSGLVKRNAASDSCSAESAGCAPGTEPASINNVCKCLTPEQLQNALNSAMDGVVQKFPWMSGLVKRSASSSECSYGCAVMTHNVCQKCMTAEERQILDQNMENLDQNMEDLKKRFQNNPWLSGLVKRSASDSCSYGCAVMMLNVCQKCMTAEERQIHDQNMENLDQNMEDLEKRFQNNPWLSGLVKRSASASECSPGNSWECIGNNCKCYDGKSKRSTSAGDNVDSGDNSLPSAREIIDSTKDKIRKDFEKNPLLSGLVKRSASASECRAGCAPPTKEIWQTNIATGASV